MTEAEREDKKYDILNILAHIAKNQLSIVPDYDEGADIGGYAVCDGDSVIASGSCIGSALDEYQQKQMTL